VFVATTLLYPCALAALCAGAGLLVDRLSGGFLPASLLLTVGAAGLIALSQLSTYVSPLAPATPYLLAVAALAGFALEWRRVRVLAHRAREHARLAVVSVAAYLLALAPVLLAGRPTFSSYMALADSAVHLLGADYLIRHGQDYAHLDLRNSYGQFLNDYYNSSYPSGADTLFGGSAFLVRVPLIWAYQPFNAFMLALSTGPAWLLARRMGLDGWLAALAALTAALPALVYAYELLGSVKEVTALSMLLTLGCLVALHRSWLRGPPLRGIPFALVLAAGLSALGAAFGAWALAAVVVLAAVLGLELHAGRARARGSLLLIGGGALTLLICAWPTWANVSGSLRVAQDIASTSNSGNLHAPLHTEQVLGIWLSGSYKLAPNGAALAATHILIAIAIAAALLGALHVLRLRAYPLAGWLALTLLASLAVSESVSTWAEAKTLVLTSPIVVLLAWGGVATLRGAPRSAMPRSATARLAAVALAIVIAGGVLASDALQYHSSDLAPTARYQEMARVNSLFAGKGPTLFTDFDEYSLYELRDLDVGGPDFVYPPAALAAAARGYGDPVEIDRVPPSALLAYPLIVSRRDPAASRPPSAYRLLWQGSYYEVWGRKPNAPAASIHVALAGSRAMQCARIAAVARQASRAQEQLIAAASPELIRLAPAHAHHPSHWGHERAGLVMSTPGTLSLAFTVPSSGVWNVWVQGQIMPTIDLSVDGQRLSSIAGQLSGNSLVPDTVPPVAVRLAAGEHRVSVTRPGFSLSPGDGGAAVLDAILLTPARSDPQGPLRAAVPSSWRTLCGRSYQWVELVPSIGART
jgi:hypothetical protein